MTALSGAPATLSRIRIALATAACAAVLAACTEQSAQGPALAKDDIAATVNGRPISERLLALIAKQRTDLGKSMDPEMRKTYLDRLALQLAVAMEAEKKGMDKRPEVLAQIELNRQSILVNTFVEDLFKSNPVTDADIKAEYDRLKTDETGNEYQVRHILVESEGEAKAIIGQLKKNPKAFDALAREKSKDSVSKERGGELGWLLPKRMVPEFGNAVVKLEKGKFAQEPVKSTYGYHVILLEDTRPMVVAPIEQYKVRLKDRLEQQKLQNAFDEVKAKAKIEIVPKS